MRKFILVDYKGLDVEHKLVARYPHIFEVEDISEVFRDVCDVAPNEHYHINRILLAEGDGLVPKPSGYNNGFVMKWTGDVKNNAWHRGLETPYVLEAEDDITDEEVILWGKLQI